MSTTQFDKLLAKQRTEFIDNFWLNLGDTTKISTVNELKPTEDWQKESPLLHLVDFMRQPKNFSFTCKHLFGIKLHPFQQLILEELWNRPFPMLIATRGGGKSFLLALYSVLKALFVQGSKVVVTGAGYRQAKLIYEYCETLWKNSPIFQDILSDDKLNRPTRDIDRCLFRMGQSSVVAIPTGDGGKIRGIRACVHPDTIIETSKGLMRIKDYEQHLVDKDMHVYTGNTDVPLEQPTRFIITRPLKSYKVTTVGGYSLICSDIHRLMTINGWKDAKDLTIDDQLVYNPSQFKFPEQEIVVDGFQLDEKLAWLMGIWISEGSISERHGRIGFNGVDFDFVNKYKNELQIFGEKYNLGLNICVYDTKEKINKYNIKSKSQRCITVANLGLRNSLEKMGLERHKSYQKIIPWSVLRSPINVVKAFLSGLFAGDGTCFVGKLKHTKRRELQISYYTSSLQLAEELQVLLSKLDIVVSLQKRWLKLSPRPGYVIRATGHNSIKLYDILDVDRWKHLRGTFDGPVKKLKAKTFLQVKNVEPLPNELILRDFTLPVTHSFVSGVVVSHNTDLLCDEFNSIDPSVYEHVMQGFAAVTATPVDNIVQLSKIEAMKQLGELTLEEAEQESSKISANKSIISGTCGYEFESLARYYKKYKAIIQSKGDIRKLEEIFQGEIPLGFNWRDYSVIRIPHDLIPRGFMSERDIGKAKATLHIGMFGIEYGAVFLKDSNGFYKRSLIEHCVCGNRFQPLIFPSCGEVRFSAVLKGDFKHKYVMAVDPASEVDNFTIKILEIHPDHRRIVYGWSINKARHKARLKKGVVQEHDYYRYCARKIRELRKLFYPCQIIGIDSQGGGFAVMEALGDPLGLKEGEAPIYPIVDEDDPKPTDDMPGEHIIRIVSFADNEWVCAANHGLRKDMEDRMVVFPYFDSAAIGMAMEEDKISGRVKVDPNDESIEQLYDSLEDCMTEIEELKNELTIIVHSKTPAGRDKWDVPEIRTSVSKKGKLRKDRYSALLMANACARELASILPEAEYRAYGGIAQQIAATPKKQKDPGQLYSGPDWFVQQMKKNSTYGTAIRKKT